MEERDYKKMKLSEADKKFLKIMEEQEEQLKNWNPFAISQEDFDQNKKAAFKNNSFNMHEKRLKDHVDKVRKDWRGW